MPGDIELRYDFDKMFMCVRHDFPHLLLRVVSIKFFFFRPVAGLATYAGKFRILLYFGTPCLVFSQVPVEDVHFVESHEVNVLLNLFDWLDVPATIQHETTPSKARGIFNCNKINF